MLGAKSRRPPGCATLRREQVRCLQWSGEVLRNPGAAWVEGWVDGSIAAEWQWQGGRAGHVSGKASRRGCLHGRDTSPSADCCTALQCVPSSNAGSPMQGPRVSSRLHCNASLHPPDLLPVVLLVPANALHGRPQHVAAHHAQQAAHAARSVASELQRVGGHAGSMLSR